MALPIDISLYTSYGKISSFLAASDFAQQGILTGRSFATPLPQMISVVTDLIEWNNTRDPTDQTLIDTGNYFYQLLGRYVPKAKQLIANMGQGIIVNPANGVQSTLQPIYLQFRIGVTGSPVVINGANVALPIDGDSSFILPLTYVIASLEITLDGVEVPINDSFQLSMNINYTNSNATIAIANGGQFHNNDLWIISGYQYVAI
jgi:hypothetical protein